MWVGLNVVFTVVALEFSVDLSVLSFSTLIIVVLDDTVLYDVDSMLRVEFVSSDIFVCVVLELILVIEVDVFIGMSVAESTVKLTVELTVMLT